MTMKQEPEAPLWAKASLWASILFLLGLLMYGCAPRYQPPGEDLWKIPYCIEKQLC